MIIKLLALVAILAMIYFVFFKKPATIEDRQNNKKNNKEDESVMVECPKCGVFVSNKEAILKNGQFFCSRECAGV